MAKPPALESKKRARRVRRAGVVHKDHEPTPLVVVNEADPLDAVLEIQAEIRRLWRTGVASYLFIDRERRAYVISEERSVAAVWVREHFSWLVALYASRSKQAGVARTTGGHFIAATVDGLVEDIEAHLADLRRLIP